MFSTANFLHLIISYLGLFYVIDGLLDVSMPSDEQSKDKEKPESTKTSAPGKSVRPRPDGFLGSGTSGTDKPMKSHKHLFTVRPGGIAGYLGMIILPLDDLWVDHPGHAASLTGTASYVDIRAKTNTYVGFLPSHALERLLEKRPIVLLTLAKRLISLLSPLGLYLVT